MHSELTDLLTTQAGVIARWQARALGMSLRQLDHKLATKQWLTRYPGIYVTSDMSSAETDLWVAILLCSKEVVLTQGRPDEIPAPDAVLSHETAAGLYGLRDADPGEIHLTVPTSRRKSCGGEVSSYKA